MIWFENSTVTTVNTSSLNEDYVNTASSLMAVEYYVSLIRVCVLHPLGIIGSVFTVLIISRTTFGSKSYRCCILLTATTDGLRLLVSSIRTIHFFMLWPVARWFCRITTFMLYFTSILSDNIILLLAIERAVAVAAPLKVQLIVTLKRLLSIILLIIVYDILVNIHQLIFTIDTNGRGGCSSVKIYINILQIFNMTIMVNFLIVVLTPCMCSILIVYKLKQQQIQMASSCSGGTNNNTQVTAMLLGIIMLYIITTLPVLGYFLYSIYISQAGTGKYHGKSDGLILLGRIAHVCKEIGHVGNFYVYCVSAKIFRQSFIDLIMSCPLLIHWKCRNSV